MSKSLNTLLSEADQIIAKHASVKKTEPIQTDDIFKLAQQLTTDPVDQKEDWSVLEKIAWAQAITDTVNNLNHIQKLAEFEKQATERGFPKKKISEYINKYAQDNYVSSLPKVLR
jgi:hypothetical protein